MTRNRAQVNSTTVRALRGEGGFSLVESLTALALLAIVFGGLAAGLLLTMRTSSRNEHDVDATTSLANITEELKSRAYVPCASATSLTTSFAGRSTAAGRAMAVEVTGVRYWNLTTRSFGTTCPPDGGSQLVSITVAVGDAVVRGEVVLRNCPFHRLAEEERPLVCGMNLDYLEGCLGGAGATGELTARLAPEPGYCCVRLSERSAPAG